MNKNIKTYFLAAGVLLAFNACQDMLDTNSSLVSMEDEYTISNEAEAATAWNGVLSEMVPLADRYVLLGELRGDLMTTSDEFASSELQEVNRFEVSKENEYADRRDYYNVINNVNLLLQKLDTSVVMQNEKVFLSYHFQAKALRALVYFQLGLAYGKVTYFTQPILDLEASLVKYPEIPLDELVDILIGELSPYISSANVDLNLWAILGDLYLYKNDYRAAASLYYDLIYRNEYGILDNANRWVNTNMESVAIGHIGTYLNETFLAIPGATDSRNIHSNLVSLSYSEKPSILPSAEYVRFMSEALYLFNTSGGVMASPSGDLRGMIPFDYAPVGDAYIYENIEGNQAYLIYKYAFTGISIGSDPNNKLTNGILYVQETIPVYRYPHLYLRFAEALNRLNKPTLAFAVLKYGLTYANVEDPITGKVNREELGESFTRFPQATFFDLNKSMTARGRGEGIPLDTAFFVIPELPAKQDSVLWVEDRILEEMAAETPFEGNRFFDLLRVSRRRANHPAFMAEKVSNKYSNKEEMKAKLMNLDTWFLP